MTLSREKEYLKWMQNRVLALEVQEKAMELLEEGEAISSDIIAHAMEHETRSLNRKVEQATQYLLRDFLNNITVRFYIEQLLVGERFEDVVISPSKHIAYRLFKKLVRTTPQRLMKEPKKSIKNIIKNLTFM